MSTFAGSASYYGGPPGCFTMSNVLDPGLNMFGMSNAGWTSMNLTLEFCYETCVANGDFYMGVYSTLKSHAIFSLTTIGSGNIVGAFAVVHERGIAIATRSAAKCSRSRRTVRSAFSQTISDALV